MGGEFRRVSNGHMSGNKLQARVEEVGLERSQTKCMKEAYTSKLSVYQTKIVVSPGKMLPSSHLVLSTDLYCVYCGP